MLAKFIDKLLDVATPKTYNVGEKTYSNEVLYEVKPLKEEPQLYTVYTLGSIVKIIRAELKRHTAPLFVNVINERTVEVVGTYNDDYSRYSLYVAKSDVPGFNQGFREIEKAIIELRSLFVPSEGTAYVLDLLSRIGKNDSIQVSDNGVTQTVETSQGVALKAAEKINPRVTLRPFRTFLEVEQPESDYLLRVDAEKGIGLFEADGGVWKLEAKRNISDYFKRELEDLINSGDVVILA